MYALLCLFSICGNCSFKFLKSNSWQKGIGNSYTKEPEGIRSPLKAAVNTWCALGETPRHRFSSSKPPHACQRIESQKEEKKNKLTHIYKMKGPFLTFLVHTHVAHRLAVRLNSQGQLSWRASVSPGRLEIWPGWKGWGHRESVGLLVCLDSTDNASTIAKQGRENNVKCFILSNAPAPSTPFIEDFPCLIFLKRLKTIYKEVSVLLRNICQH